MKQYKYKVNGAQYDVTINEIQGQLAKVVVNGIPFDVEMQNSQLSEDNLPDVTTTAAPSAVPAAPVAAAPAATEAAPSGAGEGTPVKAPRCCYENQRFSWSAGEEGRECSRS